MSKDSCEAAESTVGAALRMARLNGALASNFLRMAWLNSALASISFANDQSPRLPP